MLESRTVKPFLIVKVGSALDELVRERGDFEAWFIDALGIRPTTVRVADVRRGDALPSPREVGAVLITGSAAMVTARAPWSVRTAAWLPDVLSAGVPLLGVCYGHQLVADALGGEVGRNPRGREIGTVEVKRTPEAAEDPLLASVPERFTVQNTHVEAVLRLPPGAVRLARSPGDVNHAFRAAPRAWCVQFHPEMDAAVIRRYIAARAKALRAENLDPDALIAAAHDSPHGRALLRRFASLAGYSPSDHAA